MGWPGQRESGSILPMVGATNGVGRWINPQCNALRIAGAGDEARQHCAGAVYGPPPGAPAIYRGSDRDCDIVPGPGANDDVAAPQQPGAGLGIQFQNPWFIAGMTLVMVLFAASLLGLFELRLSSGATTFLATRGGTGLAGHFWQGALATLLATPCTAPFLGTAVSVALVAPLPLLWGLFLVMGLGMSLPWLLIALWPGLALRLPRPGRWMNTLKVLLGLMMLGSALWLGSLMASHIGQRLTLGLLVGVSLVLLAATLRRWGWRTAAISGGLAALLVAIAFLLIRPQATALVADRVNWQPLTEQAIAAALADNKQIFIDVTADWCVTCKANKYNVLLREEMQNALSAPGVVALRGDWTQPSATISQFLRDRHSVAVPFNQIYGPGMPQGLILPPLLNRDDVLHALDQAKGH